MPKVTVIIVKYRAPRELAACLASLKGYHTIVVDNDKINRGYAAGNNLGAIRAKGEYLLILNPDTVVYPGAIKALVKFLDAHPRAGIVAPLLLDPAGKPYPLQGTRELTPLTGIFALSFLNHIPNPVSNYYWLKDWDKSSPRQVDVIPGTAFLIRRDLFNKIGGFDENFFLYFDETDLCRRVRQAGWDIYIDTEAKVMHHWAASTPKSTVIKKIFAQSRFYYFEKHFGFVSAVLVHWACSLSFRYLILIAIGLTLLMQEPWLPIIADQEWFFASARAARQGELPLLGITSSITWLHQGSLWTYLLVPEISGRWIATFLALFTLTLMYFWGRKGGLFLLLINPWFWLTWLMPYHLSPIPLFELVTFFCFIKRKYFLLGLFMGWLYQLHLLTFVFWPLLLFRLRLSTISGFLIGIFPFLVAGPTQTLGIFVWLLKHVSEGFAGSGVSHAYMVVLLIPITLAVLKCRRDHSYSFN